MECCGLDFLDLGYILFFILLNLAAAAAGPYCCVGGEALKMLMLMLLSGLPWYIYRMSVLSQRCLA